MCMTLGDAAASLVGMRWGRHRYTVFGHTRTWEGTCSMAAVSLTACLLTLFTLPGSSLSPNSVPWSAAATMVLALVASMVATGAEAVSPAGTDNLAVPLLSGLAMHLVSGLL